MKKRFYRSLNCIGVFALQGSFAEHISMLTYMGVPAKFIRSFADTAGVTACILPGGESTTLMKLLKKTGLDKWLIESAKKGMPIYGTCAGMIVLANLGLMDIKVDRNAYGPQLYSFEDTVILSCRALRLRSAQAPSRHLDQMPPRAKLGRHDKKIPGIFIRAPRVISMGPKVKILATHGRDPVLVQQKNLLASSFHPELTMNTRIHKYFMKMMACSRGTLLLNWSHV